MCAEQRKDVSLYARGIRAWLQGEESDRAEAAGRNVANVLLMWRSYMGAKD